MDKDTIRTILCYIRKHTFLVVLSLVLAAVTVVSTLYLPILTGHAIDCMIAKGKVDFAALRPILEKMIVTLAITGFSQWLMNVCNNRITYLVMREIREDAFHHIHDLPLKYLDGHPSGDIVSRVIADVDQFADDLIFLIEGRQLGLRVQRLLDGHLEIIGDELGDAWHIVIYAARKYMDHVSRCTGNATFLFRGRIYCQKDTPYVLKTV